MNDTKNLITELLLQAAEGANKDTMRRLISVAEKFGHRETVSDFRKKLASLIANDPSPDRFQYTGSRIDELTHLGALSEAVDIALSEFLINLGVFYDLVLKVHEAGMVEAEKKLIERFRKRFEQEDQTDLPPEEAEFQRDFCGPRWILRKGLTPTVHRVLGFDILATIKKREAELLSEIPGRDNELWEYLELLFLYARFKYIEEAERFRLVLLHQFDPESERPADHKQIFPGTTMSELARLPDGFTPEGEPFYRRDEQGNLQRAVEQMIACSDVKRISGEFDGSCVSIFEEQSKKFLYYSTDILTASIPRMPEEVSRTSLYNSLLTRRYEFLSVEIIDSLMPRAIEALRKEIERERQDRDLHFWIFNIACRDTATALKWCLEQTPKAREESVESIAYWLENPVEAKQLISLFSEPCYHELFHRDFIPKFLNLKLEFPVQWIDEKIASAQSRNDVRREADLLVLRFVHQSLFGGPTEAKQSLDTAIEIIRTIDMDAEESAKRKQEWLERLPENSPFEFESDTEWKPEALLRVVQALAFVGWVDEALSFEDEYVQAEKAACDFTAKGLSELNLIGDSVQNDRKVRYEQSRNIFRLEIASAVIHAGE